jgi:hypothetical protein
MVKKVITSFLAQLSSFGQNNLTNFKSFFDNDADLRGRQVARSNRG